jgi:hypothetical protein
MGNTLSVEKYTSHIDELINLPVEIWSKARWDPRLIGTLSYHLKIWNF